MINSAWIDEYGQPLVPLDDEKLNAGKSLRIQDQIATDENGRRRFHGAFTGGFSAGYWNTVGSQEGWTPQNFKSSRAEKAAPMGQKPLDFMDEEDLEEFGNAPLSLQEREDDPTIITADEINLKRVLSLDKSKIMAATEPERQARRAEREKRKAEEFNKRKLYVLQKYGCDTTSSNNVWHSVAEEDIDAAFQPTTKDADDATFPIEDLVPEENKSNTFGLGDFTPLDSDAATSSTINEKKKTTIPVQDAIGKSRKKLSIRGQAFGVGALEEDDEDIYEREDMSIYDFSLDDRKKKKRRIIKMLVKDDNSLEADVPDVEQRIAKKDVAEQKVVGHDASLKNSNELDKIEDPLIPNKVQTRKFVKPRHWNEGKSRFAPMPNEEKHQQNNCSREKLYKPDDVKKSNAVSEEKRQQLLATIGAKTFISALHLQPEDQDLALQKEADIQEHNATKKIDFPLAVSTFKPFDYDPLKQTRYEKFLASVASSEKEIGAFLKNIQPAEMSEWDREMEKKEFIQSRKLYKPLEGDMANRFITGTIIEDLSSSTIPKESEKCINKERNVVVVRTTTTWKPCAQLCKRYNIAEPFTDPGNDSKNSQMKHRKKPHSSIFDYIEGSVHTKADFVTPVIIPKHKMKAEEIIKAPVETKNVTVESPVVQPANRKSRWDVKSPKSKEKQEELLREKPSPEMKKTNDLKSLKFIPKNERNIEIDLPLPVANRGLFQAIFSENEEDDIKDQQSTTSSVEIREQCITSSKNNISSAATKNLLRNMSPPRGLFAAFFTSTESTENTAERAALVKAPLQKQQKSEKERELDKNCYGPVAPTNVQNHVDEGVAEPQFCVEPLEQRILFKGVEIIEKWVESSERNESENSDSNSDSSSRSYDKKSRKHKKSIKRKKSKKSKKNSKKKCKEKHKYKH